jgi:hypothetical protein
LYGRFVCTNYTAEGVDNWETPVQVKATQMQKGVAVEAMASFLDPAVTLQGYTLKPQMKWTTGDIKGYNEGDCVPYKLKLDKKFFGNTVTVTMGFDYANEIFDIYGIDYLCAYNQEPPTGPFDNIPASSTPFSVDAGQGSHPVPALLRAERLDEGELHVGPGLDLLGDVVEVALVVHLVEDLPADCRDIPTHGEVAQGVCTPISAITAEFPQWLEGKG